MGAFDPKFPRTAAAASNVTVVPNADLTSTDVQAALEELQTEILANEAQHAGKIPKTGIDATSAGAYTSTLTYNEATRTITIAPTGSSFDVFVLGVKFTKTSESLAHTTTQGNHFFYYDETGTLVHSLSPWNLLRHAPVAFVYWDATNSRGICFEERHHAGRDVWWHRNQHTNEGTKASSGFSITGYTLNDGSLDSSVTYSIATGRLEDEDIQVDTETLTDNGPYTLLQRSGASGDWLLTRTNVLPFHFSGNTLQYNQFTGATWQLTNVTEDFFVNYWVFGTTALPAASVSPAPGAVQQFVIIPGQAIYSTEPAAHAESVASIAWGNIPFQEICPLYQVTMRFNATVPSAYTNTARCAITRVLRVVGTSASISAAGQTDHGALTGLGDLDHPASAIIFTPAGNIAATDVQAAIQELDTEKLAKTGDTAASLTITSVDINGGTIDGTVIGGASAAVLTCTNLVATGNVTLGDSAGDITRVNGTFGVGGAGDTTTGFKVLSTNLVGLGQVGISSEPTFNSQATTSGWCYRAQLKTQAASFTMVSGYGARFQNPSLGATSEITTYHHHQLDDVAVGSGITNANAISISMTAGATKYAINSSGNAQSVHAGNVRIGSTTAPTVALDVTGSLIVSNNATFGDAAGDILTINGTAVSIPNNLNFDSNTFVIDSSLNAVGVGLAPTSRNNTSLQTVNGLGFPATQVPSSDPNTLDDYEEGTFTPTIVGTSTAGTATYTFQTGKYTKIGNRVFYNMNITYSGHTGTGNLRISGLPFTSNATGTWVASIIADSLTFSNSLVAYIDANSTQVLVATMASGAGIAFVPMDALATLYVTGHYEV